MRVSTQELCVTLGGRAILQNVSLTVEPKQFVGVIGPNGSGKSTLLKCMYRMQKPDAGSVLFDDVPLLQMRVRESARRVAVLAQHNDYSFDFTVREMVLLGRTPHKRMLERDTGEDFAIAQAALEQVGLQGFEERLFFSLSGGERQRVLLARALAQQTPCLILDEPTNHLDIQYQLQLMEIVRGLGITVIAAIHDLNIAAMYCDAVYVLHDGRIVAQGTPREVLTPELIAQVYRVRASVEYWNDVPRIWYHAGSVR